MYKIDRFVRTYEPPNGGRRMLPSAYTTLTTRWVTCRGEIVSPRLMSDHHLWCSHRSLEESLNNIISRCDSLFDKMALHFRNVPEVLEGLKMASEAMHRADLAAVYPVAHALATELIRKGVSPSEFDTPKELFVKDFDLTWGRQVIIELTKAVSVRTNPPEGAFIEVPAGTKVNYAGRRNGDHMVHTFWYLHKGRTIEHMTVTEASDKPDWL